MKHPVTIRIIDDRCLTGFGIRNEMVFNAEHNLASRTYEVEVADFLQDSRIVVIFETEAEIIGGEPSVNDVKEIEWV